jgi:Ribbon-helix-helix protein, copG family
MSARTLCTGSNRDLCNTIFGVRKTTRVDPSKPHRTKTGKVLTDADIEALAAEVERDYDVTSLKARRRGRPPMGSAAAEVVPVRLDPDLKKAVEMRAAHDDTTTSEIIREAIRSFLERA